MIYADFKCERRHKNSRLLRRLADIARATLIGVAFSAGMGLVLVCGMAVGSFFGATF